MNKTVVRMESNEQGFSLDTSGSVVIMGAMIGRTIADIEAKVPALVAQMFWRAIIQGYEGGEEDAENAAVTGDS